MSAYCCWNVSSHLQSGWRGRPSLPPGFTSSRDQRDTHQSERFGLWLAPPEAQCPGQTGTNTRCLAAAGPEPPWSHTDTPEPTCWSKLSHVFSETQTLSTTASLWWWTVNLSRCISNHPPSQQKSDWLSFSYMQTFLVRKSTSMQRKVISVRMDLNTAIPVQDFPVRENRFSMYREYQNSLSVCFLPLTSDISS